MIVTRYCDKKAFLFFLIFAIASFVIGLIFLWLSYNTSYQFWLDFNHCINLNNLDCVMNTLSKHTLFKHAILSVASIFISINGLVVSFILVSLYKVKKG